MQDECWWRKPPPGAASLKDLIGYREHVFFVHAGHYDKPYIIFSKITKESNCVFSKGTWGWSGYFKDDDPSWIFKNYWDAWAYRCRLLAHEAAKNKSD